MNKTELNNGNLVLTLLEGFEKLSAADVMKMTGKEVDEQKMQNNECMMIDREKHLVLEVSWRKAPFISFLAKLEESVGYAEKSVAKQVPSYKKVCDIRRTVCGEKTCGFQYSYTASDIDMVADYMILKHGKEYYYFLWLVREEGYEEYHDVIDTILDSVEFR